MSAKWQTMMKKVDGLIGTSNGNLFERAKLLVAIWNDGEFLAFHNGDVDKAEESLNSKLGDYGLTIFDVKAMLGEFPNKAEWESGKLREMLATSLEAEDSRRKENSRPRAERKSPVPRKEFEQVQKTLQATQARVESMGDENARLREENARLRAELAHANGRIDELERVLKMQAAAA